jgi:dihydrolipoamide dehydrogenase
MAEQTTDFDLVVLGGGIGGYVTAIRAAELGLSVCLIEQDKMGGVCLHRGCIPTKIIYRTADLWDQIKMASELGIEAKQCRVDWPGLMSRKQRIVMQLATGVEFLLKKHQISVMRGRGRFSTAVQLDVTTQDGGSQQVTGKNVVVATGSVPRGIDGLQPNGDRILNAYQALDLPEIPRSVAIAGAGTTGMEFVSLWNSFDAEVTVFEKESVLIPRLDEEVGAELEKIFSRRGVKVHTGRELKAEDVDISGDLVRISTGPNEAPVEVERLIMMTGRLGNTRDIGLETAGIEIKDSYIAVDSEFRTSVPNVFAIGDVIGGPLLAHAALAHGTYVAERIAGLAARPPDPLSIPLCIYCYPQVAGLGLSEEKAKNAGYQVKIGRFPMRANSRSVIAGRTDGFVKIVSDEKTGEILGAFVVGRESAELIGEVVLARYLEGTAHELGNAVRPHPTVSEAIREAALDIESAAIHY